MKTAMIGGRSFGRGSRGLGVVAAAMSLVMAAPVAAQASVSATPTKTARVNGTVFAIAQVGDRTIIGGDFTAVGDEPRNHVAAIRADGTVDPTFNPNVDGIVYALAGAPDGSAIYLGGTFSQVGGSSRANLAAVDATGAVKADWSADTTGETPDVSGLAMNGTNLYASGRFTGIDGTTRKRLVMLNAAGNVVTTFNATPNWTVRVVAPSADGTRLFAGGGFSAIGGASRAGIAELNPATGSALPFTVTPVGSPLVAMGISPAGDRLYYGTADNRVFAYDTATGAKVWENKNGGDTQVIAVGATEVYLGGHFGNNLVDKVKRKWIQSVNASDGHVTAWDPQLAGGGLGVWAILATPTALLVGGEFTTAAGQVQRRFARFPGTP